MSNPDDPTEGAGILPIGDRQLERIQPDQTLAVEVRPVSGSGHAAAIGTRVLDLSLHGLLLEAVPSLEQDTLIDIIGLEADPIRASVVRQSALGTHVSFVDHLHPRYRRSAGGQPNRRRYVRVPCEAPVNADASVGTVLDASRGGVMIRVAEPGLWTVGNRVALSIDGNDGSLAGEVVAVTDDRVSLRFARVQDRLRITAPDCLITLEQKAGRRAAASKAKVKKAKAKAKPKPKAKAKPQPKPKRRALAAKPKRRAAAKPKRRAAAASKAKKPARRKAPVPSRKKRR